MKIVFFDFVTHFGGASQLAADTAKRLAADNHIEVVDVYGVCKEYLKTLKDAGIKTHILVPEAKSVYIGYQHSKARRLLRMICQIPIFWRLRKKMIRKILQINPDVIWTNSANALLFLEFSFRLRRYSAAMYACGYPEAASIHRWRRWVMKRRAAVVMASSTETAKQLQLMGIKAERIKVVFETIDFADTIARSKAALEAPLPGMNGSPRILVPATLLRTKGQHTAIKAVAHLKKQGLNPTLWLAGDVAGNDQSYIRHLHALIEQLEISENVYFLGWRHDVPAIMVQSDIVVLPTHTEGFGRVTLEAMLLRRPAVATPVGGMKDSIQHGHDGLFFPVDDDEALARHLVRLAIDNQFTAELVENGYKTATEKFNPEIHTERVRAALAFVAEPIKSKGKFGREKAF
jgi:glycosyltransferase involved in cell wall biosynthesis